ncbi:MAG: hypothetical protein SNF33_01555 [Candidatus Algichlamydia australiensis]|nr:hypothetical protein [Chlamydiales bacterium]
MKSLLVITLTVALSVVPAAMQAQNDASTTLTYDGSAPSKAADEAISSSMIGWGIALAIGITILAIVLGSNDNSQAQSQS